MFVKKTAKQGRQQISNIYIHYVKYFKNTLKIIIPYNIPQIIISSNNYIFSLKNIQFYNSICLKFSTEIRHSLHFKLHVFFFSMEVININKIKSKVMFDTKADVYPQRFDLNHTITF